jgi:uncharacterized protein
LCVYDQTLQVMRAAVNQAKLGRDEKLAAIRRLDEEARRLEQSASGPTWNQFESAERDRSFAYGGRTVAGPASPAGSATAESRLSRKVAGD